MKRKIISALIANTIIPAVIIGAAPNVMTAPSKSANAVANYDSRDLARYAYQVAAIVNRERAANGLAPLKYSEELSNAAVARAHELPVSFSHTRPDGTLCFTILGEMGIKYRAAGENIAYGYRDPETVVSQWMQSAGHRENILNTDKEYIGIGVYYKNGIYYWTQIFASSGTLTGEVITEGTATYRLYTSALGDTNSDGNVDASDASNILKRYAELSTSSSSVTKPELYVFDVDNDGGIDAEDASTVLSYYACISTSSTRLSLENFINSK